MPAEYGYARVVHNMKRVRCVKNVKTDICGAYADSHNTVQIRDSVSGEVKTRIEFNGGIDKVTVDNKLHNSFLRYGRD